jgi:anaerobic glycerol-3-phosphate dehydrogenase
MDTTKLKKMVDNHIDDVDQRRITIETNVRKRNGWAALRDTVIRTPNTSDETILKQMTACFGNDCLKALISQVANGIILDFDQKIFSQTEDLENAISNYNTAPVINPEQNN